MSTTPDQLPSDLPQRRIDQLLAHYGQSHQHATNELIHFVAIPVIMFSLVGLLMALHPWLAYAFVAAGMVYYARLSAVFFAVMFAISAAVLVFLSNMAGEQRTLWCLALFAGAWVLQFIGHRLEGKKPSSLRTSSTSGWARCSC